MSLFKNLFGKRRIPDDSYDYRYYERLRASGKSAQAMLEAGAHHAQHDEQNTHNFQTNKLENNPTASAIPPLVLEPIDCEDESFREWSESQNAQVATDNSANSENTIVTQGNEVKTIPERPQVSGMPKLERPEIKPFGNIVNPQKTLEPVGTTKWPSIKPVIPKKDVIAFVVENSSETLLIKDSIEKLIKKIADSKKDSIFLFIKTGNAQKSYAYLNYDDVIKQDIISSLITSSEYQENVNLAAALFYLKNTFKFFASGTFTFKNEKYRLNNCSILCIGSSSFSTENDVADISIQCIKELRQIPELKNFKYFCVKDSDCIKVASLGFPVVGHIISDFYQ